MKIFETSEDLSNLAQQKFTETGLPNMGIRLKVLSVTKMNCAAKVSKANATTVFISRGSLDLVLYLYEEVLDRLNEDMRGRLIEGALSVVSYDSDKDKLNIDTRPFAEVVNMEKKYPEYVKYLETVQLTIEQMEEEEKERKLAEKEAKKAERKKS